jgi:hypothetical protein
MKRILGPILGAAALLVTTSAFAALGPVTGANSAGALANANTITVTIPGVVGVDLESDLEWDFTAMNPAPAAATCAQSSNQWPISITCSSSGSGTVVYDPTNFTDPNIGNTPRNGTTTGAANMALLSPAGEKAIWLALFCSKSGGVQPVLSATMGALTGSPVGFDESNFKIKGSSGVGSSNASGVGPASLTAFPAGGGPIASLGMGTLGAAGATFGWTRSDQVVVMELPYNAALGSPNTSVHTSTLFFTITK